MQSYYKMFVGEFIGTFILVLIGCGSVAVSVLFNVFQDLLSIALIWGIGVTLAIYATRHLSCAHLNPAVTIAMAIGKRMTLQKVPVYLVAQFLGSFIAGLTLYGLFSSSIAQYELLLGITRGSTESMSIAKIFGEFYQLPGDRIIITQHVAMFAEGLGTFLLVLFIFSLTEGCNLGKPKDHLAPIFIGLSVTVLICLIAPLTQGGFNPARDFGPRMVAWIFGWGSAAFPDNTGGFFWVYIFSPILGGALSSLIFTNVIQKLMQLSNNSCTCAIKKYE